MEEVIEAMESKEIRIMRNMAWARAKGELNSMLATYYDFTTNQYDEFRQKMEEFVDYVEGHALQE